MVDKSEKLEWMARLGFVARGVVYALLGYLALSSTGSGTVQEGQSGALEYLHEIPGGTVIMYLAAIGLLGYGVFRLLSALLDIENHGNDAKGIGTRIGHFCSAVLHFGLAWTALKFALGSKQDAGNNTQSMVSSTLTYDLGSLALGIAGIGLIVAAIYQAKQAITLGFMKRVSSRAPSWTCWLGRFGYAARALVFSLIGWSLLRSAWFEQSSEALSLGNAIMDMRDMGFLYTLVALGLLMFGIFSIIVARYRVIPDLDAGRHMHSAKHKFT
ncbi:DUF1206 domain-containing protein [Novosphingobium malaysiense]|uniref:DUF1206 domain-containing protein n=1 Tax=Novosphingobium malaysiense TaxID=1348853 RepID=A0A0B1ZQ37_9SPHN|nr:DUF1206 domain-containing protein [Novosphingobium malaysiense]KHK91322.1 hypothetical protein LK12_10625 [Novosphingobium malaysiense]